MALLACTLMGLLITAAGQRAGHSRAKFKLRRIEQLEAAQTDGYSPPIIEAASNSSNPSDEMELKGAYFGEPPLRINRNDATTTARDLTIVSLENQNLQLSFKRV